MKLALVLLVVLPMALSMTVHERGLLDGLLSGLTGGVDVLGLAKQIAAQMGTDESELACEQQLCHPIVDNIIPGTVIENIVCGTICQEAKIIAQQIPHRK